MVFAFSISSEEFNSEYAAADGEGFGGTQLNERQVDWKDKGGAEASELLVSRIKPFPCLFWL